ncbi:Alpha-amino acid ester hydrolase [Candidatus Sulfotelmatomonas gaucii]|uniref:Alpha-amino acid ester hydrolase n=1 Tax=Candidatus Sulfuritelmatomonas gaucii TaxID=2043161 RepID=A0A2N9L2S6_9BACT|nr:Alpha-amino acid ester hydrolase [Candidatus Sulfotelmatomonas gaucii]
MIQRRLFLAGLFPVLICFMPSLALAAQQLTPAASAAQLDVLAGHYTDPSEPAGGFDFYIQDGKLIVESARMVPLELSPISKTLFSVDGIGTTATFTLDSSGRGASVSLSDQPSIVYVRTGEPIRHVFHDYVRTDVMIPMRDGVKLRAVILKPADITTALPILIERTPYGVDGTTGASFFALRPELARDGYIYVGEDIRGRFKSQGKFVMARPLADHHDPSAIDESTDAFDTVAWLIKNVPGSNGRVGVVGTSYPGFLAMMAGIDPNPAVKAISPQAPMIDVWMGDDFFHNGAFRQTYGYDYVLGMETNRKRVAVDYGNDANGQPVDGFDYFLERGSFAQDVKQSSSKLLPTWKLFLEHPAYDSAWSSRGVEHELNSVTVPTLSVGGYYDQEDMYGPQEEYEKLEPHDTHHENFLVLGPWRHGYWSSSSSHLGNLDYGEPIGTEFRKQIEAKFFAHYLKGEPGFDFADTASFQTGSNTWKYYAHFPPAESRPTSLHLAGAGMLSWNASTAQATASYVSDPSDPVPYRHRPIQPTYGTGSQWYNWLTEDQGFVTGRKDVAVWKLPVLTHDLTFTGEVVADIFASTTGSDNDMVVKLIDQYPADDPDPKMRGYQLITNAEIFRGRYLSGFDHANALTPGTIYEYKFSLHDIDHVFRAGHIVMVEIQSTWFPLYDRNPQTFVPNIMNAKPDDYKSATITIYSGRSHDSDLEVPVMPAP